MKSLRAILLRILSTAKDHKKTLVVAGLILASFLGVLLFQIRKARATATYYVAYIGRYQRQGFDKLHELALAKYIEEINGELDGVRLELKTFRNEANFQGSQKAYEAISANPQFVVVVDNTWGKELQPIASFIREHQIPVIAINADKQTTDFSKNVVFIGHDDNVPYAVAAFSKDILPNNSVIFVTEESYALTTEFRKAFDSDALTVTTLSISSETPGTEERNRLFENLDTKLYELQKDKKTPTVILNTHGSWGVEIINHIDTKHKGVTILGGPYIVNWSNARQFGLNKNGNGLIMLTTPSDAVINKVYLDLKSIRHANPEVSEIVNAQLFVKRCLDATSIIRGIFNDDNTQRGKKPIVKSEFTAFFQQKLSAKEYIGKEDLYEFDNNLLLRDEKAFEKHFQGAVFSYPKQLNSHMAVIPNVYFGIEIINISTIDTDKRLFHADFFYWLKVHKEYPDVEKLIHFRNAQDSNFQPQLLIARENLADGTIYKLYKMSSDFTMEVDFTKYPLDTQELRMVVDILNPADKLRISFDHGGFEQGKKNAREFNLAEWYTKDFYVTVDNVVGNSLWGSVSLEDNAPRRFKTLNVRMPIHRHLANPFVTIVLPLVMMGIAAIASLYIGDNSFSSAGQVCVGIFLSIVTYSIAFASITPRSNVLTIADILFYGTFVTIFLVFLKVIVLNSRMMSARTRTWVVERTTLIGHVALTSYLLMIGVILVFGLT